MSGKALATFLVFFCAAMPALAGTVSIAVADGHGGAVAGAVVELVSDTHAPLPAGHVASEVVIDQRHEMFIPLVSLVRKGGQAVFTNNDTTMHQVYSFSPIKQFQFEIDQGQHSKPVVFDKAGVSSIGCNIHDQMITYVYVAESPFAAIADASGHASFDGVPPGAYHANVWHPQTLPGRPPPSQALAVSNAPVALTLTLALTSGPAPGMSHMHSGKY
jgi:plastocyanin